MSEPYENTLSIDELRREVRRAWDREHALTAALRDAPDVPPVMVLDILSAASPVGGFQRDWKLGTELQRKHGLGVIPPKTEYEVGAGVWVRILRGLKAQSEQAARVPL